MRVCDGVVTDEVTCRAHRADEVGALLDKFADDEEGGLDPEAVEHGEKLGGGAVVGTVIVGKGDLVGIMASDEGAAEELRLGLAGFDDEGGEGGCAGKEAAAEQEFAGAIEGGREAHWNPLTK